MKKIISNYRSKTKDSNSYWRELYETNITAVIRPLNINMT